MSASNFLFITTVVLSIITILKFVLEPKKAIRINNYYSVYKNHQMHNKYDFVELLDKEKQYYPLATVISLAAYLLSLFIESETINHLLVLIVFGILSFSIFYLRPRKKK